MAPHPRSIQIRGPSLDAVATAAADLVSAATSFEILAGSILFEANWVRIATPIAVESEEVDAIFAMPGAAAAEACAPVFEDEVPAVLESPERVGRGRSCPRHFFSSHSTQSIRPAETGNPHASHFRN